MTALSHEADLSKALEAAIARANEHGEFRIECDTADFLRDHGAALADALRIAAGAARAPSEPQAQLCPHGRTWIADCMLCCEQLGPNGELATAHEPTETIYPGCGSMRPAPPAQGQEDGLVRSLRYSDPGSLQDQAADRIEADAKRIAAYERAAAYPTYKGQAIRAETAEAARDQAVALLRELDSAATTYDSAVFEAIIGTTQHSELDQLHDVFMAAATAARTFLAATPATGSGDAKA